MSTQDTDKPVAQLRETLALLSTAVEKIASEWEQRSDNRDIHAKMGADLSISHVEHDAVKMVLAAIGSLESLIVEPHMRLNILSSSYTIPRALHIAAEKNVAEVLAQGKNNGVHAADLARSTGIEEKKLCKYVSKTRKGDMCLVEHSCRPHHAEFDITPHLSGGGGRLLCKQPRVASAY